MRLTRGFRSFSFVILRNKSSIIQEVLELRENDMKYLKSIDFNATVIGQVNQPRQHILAKDMHEYLKQYGYNISNPAVLRGLSALHTYPLTLAYVINTSFSSPRSELMTLIIGARAESALPTFWWRNTLINSYKMHRLHINMQGPHISSNGNIPVVVDWNNGGGCEQNRHVTVNQVATRNLLHEDSIALNLLHSTDLVLLYNPGLGHVHLREHWLPTLNILFQSKLPVYCTAFSEYDVQKDVEHLKSIQNKSCSANFDITPYQLNPFSSLTPALDKREKEIRNQIIRTNQYIYKLQGC